MRTLIALALVLCAAPAYAMSVQDWEAQAPAAQAATVSDFIEKLIADVRTGNPGNAEQIRIFFTEEHGRPMSEGIEQLYVQLARLENRAKDGRADLSKVELEAVIVWVVKQKFLPPPTAAK
jgi:hypothetical protein